MSSSSSKSGNKTASCIKNVATFSHVLPQFKFDKPDFNARALRDAIPVAAPKIQALVDKIHALDKTDKRQHNKFFKHIIYVDYKGVYAKIVTGCLIANGFNLVFNKSLALSKSSGSHNMACMCSTSMYDKTVPVRFRREIISMFNERPNNVHGEHIRFLVLDSGFREGIDCFDVKYVHIIQPLSTQADTTQAIGRATRYCGQKGLQFHPQKGWPLIVFTYDIIVPKDIDKTTESDTLFQLYMNHSGIDTRRLVLAKDLDSLVIEGAVDHELTKAVHNFSLRHTTEEEEHYTLGGKSKIVQLHKPRKLVPMTPLKQMRHVEMKEYIHQRFRKFTWPQGKLENLCVAKGGNKAEIVEFTPTQDFVRHYFQPYSSYKGMLLQHGVGVGKTCCAIATASTSWEQEGYTILWVTRHTLKADIWKNMFQQVCSLVIQDKLKRCDMSFLEPEDAIQAPLKHLSASWMAPISFKQFSNMCARKNDIYKKLVQRNGSKDPLKKTLIILDEAHKLYSKDVIGAEKPDAEAIKNALHHSFNVSGDQSARVLMMTATPYTSDPMDMINLLNLIRSPKDQLQFDFDEFAKTYLDDTGAFTSHGKARFLDQIAGYISYVNREKDARQFAYPKHHNVLVDMSRSASLLQKARVSELKNSLETGHNTLQDLVDEHKKEKEMLASEKKRLAAECKKVSKDKRSECEENANASLRHIQSSVEAKANAVREQKDAIGEIKRLMAIERKQQSQKNEDMSQELTLISKCLSGT